jgi:hypothetical protein
MCPDFSSVALFGHGPTPKNGPPCQFLHKPMLQRESNRSFSPLSDYRHLLAKLVEPGGTPKSMR